DRGVRQLQLAAALGRVQRPARLAVLAGLVHRALAAERDHVGARGGAVRALGGGLGGGGGLGHAGAAGGDLALLVAARRRRRLRIVGDAVGVLPLVDSAGKGGRGGAQAGDERQKGEAGHRKLLLERGRAAIAASPWRR